jgi:hypothetical protein
LPPRRELIAFWRKSRTIALRFTAKIAEHSWYLVGVSLMASRARRHRFGVAELMFLLGKTARPTRKPRSYSTAHGAGYEQNPID